MSEKDSFKAARTKYATLARLLPAFGILLFLIVPILLASGNMPGPRSMIIYFFVAWISLIAISAALSVLIGSNTNSDGSE